MSSWFTQKLGNALNAAAGVKRTRGDCSSSIASGSNNNNNNNNNNNPSHTSPYGTAAPHQVSTENIIVDADHSPAGGPVSTPYAPAPNDNSKMMPGAVSRHVSPSGADPRDAKRRCHNAHHGEIPLGYSDSSLSYHHDGRADHHGYYSHGWDPYSHHHHHHAGGPAYHATNESYHHALHAHHGYYAPPPAPPPPPQPTFAPSSSRFTFTRPTSAFSSIQDLDPDDAEVQEHTTPAESTLAVPSSVPFADDRYYGRQHGQWNHQPPFLQTSYMESGYPHHQCEPPNPHYPPPPSIPSPQKLAQHNTSCFSSPRNSVYAGSTMRQASEYGSAMWSTMKVLPRPSNPMATLFHYVGDEHKHLASSPGGGGRHPSNEVYYVVTDRPDSPMSEISLDSIYERGDPTAWYIETHVDEYPEYREPFMSSERVQQDNGRPRADTPMEVERIEVSRIPHSIEIPTVHEDAPYEYKHLQPNSNNIHRDVTTSITHTDTDNNNKSSPKHDRIQRIVSCEERHSAMAM